jgi:ribosomal protein S18 acetylase RimI-like enzyme
MDYETFMEKFLDYSGIDLDISYVAMDEEQPVGFILGSINDYEGIKTLRCASLGVIKDYRKKGIGSQLLTHHIQIGIDHNCQRSLLEVIKDNKAKFLYLKNGYEIIDKLFYYSLSLEDLTVDQPDNILFEPMTSEAMHSYLMDHQLHINYQNHPVMLKNSTDNYYYRLKVDNETIGVIAFNRNGTLSIVHLKPDYKQKHYLESILNHLKTNEAITDINLSVTTEMNYVSLFKSVGFVKKELEQFEMIKQL